MQVGGAESCIHESFSVRCNDTLKPYIDHPNVKVRKLAKKKVTICKYLAIFWGLRIVDPIDGNGRHLTAQSSGKADQESGLNFWLT